MKLSVDGCFKGNSSISASYGIMRDHQVVVLAGFSSFLEYQPIFLVELTAILEGLNLAAQLCFSALEIEYDLTTMVSWVLSHGSM